MPGGSGRWVGRADLLRILIPLGKEALYDSADMNGFLPPRPQTRCLRLPEEQPRPGRKRPSAQEPATIPAPPATMPACYARVVERKASTLLPESPPGQGPPLPQWYRETEPLDPGSIVAAALEPPPKEPLTPWSRLWPSLRALLSETVRTREPDIPRIIRALAQGEWLPRLPRRHRRRWAAQVQVLVERSDRTGLFNQDYNDLLTRLRQLRGETGLEELNFDNQPGRLERVWRMPVAGTRIFILSDLGFWDGSGLAQRAWLSLGVRLRRAGSQPLALVPLPKRNVPAALLEHTTCLSWDRSSRLQILRVRPP